MRSSPLPIHKALPLVAAIALPSCTSALIPPGATPRVQASAFVNLRPPREGPRGTIALTIRWPARPTYVAQVIPLRTNALVLQVIDAQSRLMASETIVRPLSGALEATASLEVGAAPNYRLRVAAYQEQAPIADSVPIAEGTATDVAVEPSSETTVRIALTATQGPEVTTMPANGGPLSFVTLTGRHFEGWGGPIKVTFGGVESPYVTGSSTELTALVPAEALDGPIAVSTDGVAASGPDTFRIIRELALSPVTTRTTVGSPVAFTAIARDAQGATIPSPVVTWSAVPPPSDLALPLTPSSTLSEGTFVPGSTGSFELGITAGSVRATASVTVN